MSEAGFKDNISVEPLDVDDDMGVEAPDVGDNMGITEDDLIGGFDYKSFAERVDIERAGKAAQAILDKQMLNNLPQFVGPSLPLSGELVEEFKKLTAGGVSHIPNPSALPDTPAPVTSALKI